MSDWFLREHHLFDGFFRISGKVSPASVRDQCVRMQALIDSLKATGRLTDRSRVLIVGAGFTGMFATSLILRGTKATLWLIEQQPQSMSVQRKVRHRIVEPAGLDWPYQHWGRTRFPIRGPSPLRWDAMPAADLAEEWDAQLNLNSIEAHDIRGRFKPWFKASVTGWIRPRETEPRWSVSFEIPEIESEEIAERVKTYEFDLCILATGVSDEEVGIRGTDYRGFAFWDPDDPIFAQPESLAGKKILIVGGGDGALGDMARLLTGATSSAGLLGQLNSVLHDRDRYRIHTLHAILFRHFLHGITLSNGSRAPAEVAALFEAQRRFMALAERIWQRTEIQSIVNDMLLPATERPFVQLLCRSSYFGFCYPRNRILGLLLAMALAEDVEVKNGGLKPFKFNCEIDTILPEDKTLVSASRGWSAAQWAAHRVLVRFQRNEEFASARRFLEPRIGGEARCPKTICGEVERADFDLIVPRVGPRPRSPFVPNASEPESADAERLLRQAYYRWKAKQDLLDSLGNAKFEREFRQPIPHYWVRTGQTI